MFVQTSDNIGIGGFIVTGAGLKHLLVRGIGPSLANFGIVNSLADPMLELVGKDLKMVNHDWRDTQQAQIQADGLAPTDNREAAIDASLPPGAYTALVRGEGSSTGVALVEVYDLGPAAGSEVANLSTRAFVNTGENIVIAGFVLGDNSGQDRIVVRGLGPSLSAFGIANVIPDPVIELRDGEGTLIRTNDDWQDDAAQAAEISAAGLAPGNAKESAMAVTLPSGLYTVLLFGVNNATGVGLVEIYDRGP
jgi:hypothetical protein